MLIQSKLLQWMQRPEKMDRTSLFELRALLARYPYYQTARLLYLKNLRQLDDPAFADELRKGALFVADPGRLFYYIEGERFVIERHPSAVAGNGENGADRTLSLIDDFLSRLPEATTGGLPLPETEEATDYASLLLREEQAEGGDTPPEGIPLKGQALIDRFIEQRPAPEVSDTGEPPLPSPSEEAAAEEEPDDERYFTETLAKIYVKQQRYDKALEIIKKLNLKYPKKNAYFADQMRFLEKLIINAKTK